MFAFLNRLVIYGSVTAPVIVILACRLIPMYKRHGKALQIDAKTAAYVNVRILKLKSPINTANPNNSSN